jgi:radical SAM protein with 4Fe4S-binding SPASM domain
MHGARELARAGIEVTLAMTLSRRNIGSLDQLASLGDGIAKRLYFSRFLPLRGGSADALDAGEWRTAMGRILALKGFEIPLRDPTFRPCFLSPVRALRAPAVAGCSIGYNSLAVESDGTAYLCRRLPVPAGNLLEDSIEEVMGQDLFRTLRDRDKLKGKCGACAYKWLCGGCRGAAYAMKCDMLAEDPQCPWPPARVHRAAAGAHPLRNRRLAP